ncbi:MAG: NADH:flavin oxidoreductase/NADH oxidase family protein [Gammaproteobacteria bacterium]|nr:NADH:flavin oxidoreductase/NADH oxidase family protein [Gammaproteobacteria bacterium]
MSTTATTIADGFTLKNGRTVQNRFMKSAMSEQLGNDDHNPDQRLVNVYGQWSKGGCGLLVSGNIMVDRNHLGEPRNVVLDEKSDLEAFRAWTAAATKNGNEFWAQLNHPGKQIPSYLNKAPVAPSAISLGRGLEKAFTTPRALTSDEVRTTIGKYAAAAKLAKEVGFTGVQIHGAHGYLVSQFLSPRHNQRDDEWGGSLENRMRFALEVYKGMREAVGDDFPVAIKLNSADFMKGGFTEEESMQFVQALSEAGIDHVEISGGTYESPEMVQETPKESTRQREAFFMDYAEKVRKVTDVPLAVTGGFRTTRGMNDALQSGAMDFVGIARPLCLDAALPNNAIADDNYRIDLPHLSTGIKGVDQLAAHNITWYEAQLWRMAKNKAPKPTMSPWRSFAITMLANGTTAMKKRRA